MVKGQGLGEQKTLRQDKPSRETRAAASSTTVCKPCDRWRALGVARGRARSGGGRDDPGPGAGQSGPRGARASPPALPGAAAPLMGGPAASGIGASTGLTPEAAGMFLPRE